MAGLRRHCHPSTSSSHNSPTAFAVLVTAWVELLGYDAARTWCVSADHPYDRDSLIDTITQLDNRSIVQHHHTHIPTTG
jgi:hypothetical protein